MGDSHCERLATKVHWLWFCSCLKVGRLIIFRCGVVVCQPHKYISLHSLSSHLSVKNGAKIVGEQLSMFNIGKSSRGNSISCITTFAHGQLHGASWRDLTSSGTSSSVLHSWTSILINRMTWYLTELRLFCSKSKLYAVSSPTTQFAKTVNRTTFRWGSVRLEASLSFISLQDLYGIPKGLINLFPCDLALPVSRL